jgi:hypothetical protein
MATLNELGRNSASITYGPSTTGAEHWPVLALFDQWTRNDTLQGVVQASSTTVTGVGTLFSTQLRAGDTVYIAGQLRTVQTVSSDTSFTVTVAFNPAVSVDSQVKMIQSTLTGTANVVVRGSNNGTVSVTNGSANVTGSATYFLAELTNAVSTVSVTGTVEVDTGGNVTGTGTSFQSGQGTANGLYPGEYVQIGAAFFIVESVTSDTAATLTTKSMTAITAGTAISKATNGTAGRTVVINGRVRVISSINSNTSLTLTQPMDFTGSGLKVKAQPRGTLAVSAGSSSVTGTNTCFSWDLVTGDQVWIGDELRTFTFSPNATTAATVSDYAGFVGTAVNVIRQAVTGIPFYRDESLVDAVGSSFTTELRAGDELIIDGTEVYVTQVISATRFRIAHSFSHSTSTSSIYKKRKLHGYVLEGTREGALAGGKFSTATTMLATAGTVYAAGTTSVVVASATNINVNNLIKVQGGGGPPLAITGQATVATSTVTGVGTAFTTQLHVGAEIIIAGQYFTVTAIASDTSLTIAQTATISSASPVFRTQPLYTYVAAIVSTTVTLGHPLKNTIYSNGTNPALIYTISAAGDFLEYVYSAPNKTAEASTTLLNTSNDRKYFGFRFYPLATGSGTGNALSTAGCAYNFTVYERWAAAYAGTNGVGVNLANLSDSTTAVSGVTDQTSMSHTTGGFLYLFAKPRYFITQGKTFANLPQAWLGVIEFERAQPEDIGTGAGTTSGVVINTGAPVSGQPGVAPWPAFAYVHGNRLPVGAQQAPTAPVNHTLGVHGNVLSCPRIRSSAGDLVGLNAHTYSALTITTGRWGHLVELGGNGSYTTPGTPAGGGISMTANTIWQPHMGHMVPVYTNIYNSKRFMFSPVVVLGTAYDPDIRGRLYGLKIIPSALGTLMDTVSVTIDSNDFYDSGSPAADHWVLTSSVSTFRMTLGGTNFQSTRSLEDTGASNANTTTAYTNNFRFALPA